MKGTDENIDQLINQKLSSGSFEIPAAFVDDLNGRLDAKFGKKKGFWFWGIIGAVLIIGAVSITWMLNSVGSQNEVAGSVIAEQGSIAKHDVHVNNDFTSEKAEELANELTNSSSSKEKSIVETSTIGSTKQTANNQEVYSEDKAGSSIELKVRGDKPSNPKTEKEHIANHETIKDNSSEVKSAPSEMSSSEENEVKDDNHSANADNSFATPEDENVAVMSEDNFVPDSNLLAEKVFVDTIKVYKDSVVIRDSVVVRDSVVIRDSVINNSANSKWELSLFGGLSKGSSNVATVQQAAGSKVRLTPGFGFGIDYSLSQFKIGSGLEYRQNSEELYIDFATQTTSDSIYISSYDPYIIYDSVGNVDTTILVPVYDTTTVTSSVTTTETVNSTISWLSIPLRFQYQLDLGNWSVIPGAALNVSIPVSGYPNQPIPWINNVVGEPKMRLNYNLSLQVRMRFGQSDNFVFMQPFYSGQLNNTTYKYSSIGVNLGVGFKL